MFLFVPNSCGVWFPRKVPRGEQGRRSDAFKSCCPTPPPFVLVNLSQSCPGKLGHHVSSASIPWMVFLFAVALILWGTLLTPQHPPIPVSQKGKAAKMARQQQPPQVSSLAPLDSFSAVPCLNAWLISRCEEKFENKWAMMRNCFILKENL